MFVHPARCLKVMVHGDDFFAGGKIENLRWMREQIEAKYEIKSEIISGMEGYAKEMNVLNRSIRWTENGIEYEPDKRHATEIIRGLGLENARAIGTPAEPNVNVDENDAALEGSQATAYRSIAARCNYLALDRGDIQFATKQCCKAMAKPTKSAWAKLRRIGRYLIGRPIYISLFRWQNVKGRLDVYTDSDWAGDKVDRKSTSGGAIMIGTHLIKAWSKDQDNIALSSGEAELYAAGLGGTQGKGVQSILKDLELPSKVRLHVDASAAIGVIQRQGLGKLRHVEVRYLWLQDELKEGRIELLKIPGTENPADLGTKALAKDEIDKCVWYTSAYFEGDASSMYPLIYADVHCRKSYFLVQK